MLSHATIGTGRHKASARGGNKRAHKVSTLPSRSSPSRSAKTVANSNLVTRPTMALVADNDADVTNGITVGGATVGILPMPPLGPPYLPSIGSSPYPWGGVGKLPFMESGTAVLHNNQMIMYLGGLHDKQMIMHGLMMLGHQNRISNTNMAFVV